jgi:hypothetical protein
MRTILNKRPRGYLTEFYCLITTIIFSNEETNRIDHALFRLEKDHFWKRQFEYLRRIRKRDYSGEMCLSERMQSAHSLMRPTKFLLASTLSVDAYNKFNVNLVTHFDVTDVTPRSWYPNIGGKLRIKSNCNCIQKLCANHVKTRIKPNSYQGTSRTLHFIENSCQAFVNGITRRRHRV